MENDFSYREKAWRAGNKAALEGRPRTDNNRQEGTIFWDDWHDGYNDGERELREKSYANG